MTTAHGHPWRARRGAPGTAAKLDRDAGVLMTRYLAWVGFAGVLNTSIVRRDRLLA